MADSVKVSFKDGTTTIEGDVLVGADGLYSSVQNYLNGQDRMFENFHKDAEETKLRSVEDTTIDRQPILTTHIPLVQASPRRDQIARSASFILSEAVGVGVAHRQVVACRRHSMPNLDYSDCSDANVEVASQSTLPLISLAIGGKKLLDLLIQPSVLTNHVEPVEIV